MAFKPKVYRIISALNTGGVEKKLVSLLPLLLSDFDIRVICLREFGDLASELESTGVRVIHFPFKSRLHPASVLGLRRLLRAEEADIVHTHMYRPHVSGIVSAVLAGVPVRISNVHNLDQWDSIRQIWMDRTVARFCTCIIAVSRAVQSNYIKQTGFPASRCHIIHNGVDTERFHPIQSEAGLYESLNLAPSDIILGTIGRLVEAKDHLLLLESVLRIREVIPSIRVLIIGDGPLKEKLQSFAAEHGISENVIFTGFRRDVEKLVNVCHVVVFPSRREGFSNALLESLACARPVIATAVGGNPEAIIHNRTGLLIPPGDSDKLIHACVQLLGNPELCRKLGESGRAHVLQNFSLMSMVTKTRELYFDLLAKSGRRR